MLYDVLRFFLNSELISCLFVWWLWLSFPQIVTEYNYANYCYTLADLEGTNYILSENFTQKIILWLQPSPLSGQTVGKLQPSEAASAPFKTNLYLPICELFLISDTPS